MKIKLKKGMLIFDDMPKIGISFIDFIYEVKEEDDINSELTYSTRLNKFYFLEQDEIDVDVESMKELNFKYYYNGELI